MRQIAPSLTFVFIAAFGGLVCGCSDDATEHDMGSLRGEATIDPASPVVGENTMYIELFDAEDQPLEGATIVVDPQMPEHGHGSPDVPVITDMGDGDYEAFPVTLFMPGMWEVTNITEVLSSPVGA